VKNSVKQRACGFVSNGSDSSSLISEKYCWRTLIWLRSLVSEVMMAAQCSYCKGAIDAGTNKCPNCGGPVTSEEARPDFRTCPRCHRKLLALASPACSYCGERLPEEYIKVREADLHRIADITKPPAADTAKIDEMIRREGTRKGTRSSLLDFIDVVDLTDLFS
jgi:RNA polymerase subunit RPABC4/transcription elongation factor Spt4